MNIPFHFNVSTGTYYGFMLDADDVVSGAKKNLILSGIKAAGPGENALDIRGMPGPGWLAGWAASVSAPCLIQLGLWDGSVFSELYRWPGTNNTSTPWFSRQMEHNGGGGFYVRQNQTNPLHFVLTIPSGAGIEISGDIDWLPEQTIFPSPALT